MRLGPASLSLFLLCACPGDPLEADSGTASGSSSSGSDASATMTGNATLTATGGMSATIGSDSNDGSGNMTDPSATSATTSDTQTSDTQTSDTQTSETDATTTDATTTDATTETTASEESTTTTGDECVGDEAMLHQDSGSAIALAGLDCDDAAALGAGVIDDATWEDWWSFYGSDAGTCEPDMVRVQVTSGGPMQVCAYLELGCVAVCSVGVSDGLGLGCCGDDQVVFSAACGQDDSSLVAIRFGDGSEQCRAFTFSYEF
ncbi:MAG TPA: hypothetical protein VG755_20650 [Nannocystaceae bacterium]|nr:hypothetical protein [Nannocystaceae bacterium]